MSTYEIVDIVLTSILIIALLSYHWIDMYRAILHLKNEKENNK